MVVDKNELMNSVLQLLKAKNRMPASVVKSEVDWFFNKMGMDESYFTFAPKVIADHVLTLHSSKVLHDLSAGGEQHGRGIKFVVEKQDSAMFACAHNLDEKGYFDPHCVMAEVERVIENKYLLEGHHSSGAISEPFRLRCYRTSGTISSFSSHQLRLYFLQRPRFTPGPVAEGEASLEALADSEFLSKVSANSREIYHSMLKDVAARPPSNHCPVFRVAASTAGPHEARLLVCYRRGTTHGFFSGLPIMYDNQRLFAHKKAIEHFKHGWSILSLHLRNLGQPPDDKSVSDRVGELARQASFSFVLPCSSLSVLQHNGGLKSEHVTYLFCAWKFAFHFIDRLDEEYQALLTSLEHTPDVLHHLYNLKASLRKHTFSESRLLDIFRSKHCRPTLTALFLEFKRKHDPVLSRQQPWTAKDDESLEKQISQAARTDLDRETLLACRNFNKHLLKTNFYKAGKLGLSFRLDPRFLAQDNFPVRPFGVFLFIGAEYRGFHIRFADIARGGLRLIRSRDANEYLANAEGLFEENYNLALTQQRKNKDIPEGGSKGTILMAKDQQHKGDVAFLKYIDSMLDLMLIDPKEVIDHYKEPEILFCGPDENTANYMDSAAHHARARGYPYWRAFTTGKSISMGGIPHDMFGMTTRSVHQYVLGVLRKLGKREEDVTKLQTGGPDGDLGSNEILISHDKTKAIVDGSGVLFDPNGINREELTRLANGRLMVAEVDKSRLSSSAQLVLLSDRDLKLADGSVVQTGLTFRNNFHLSPMSSADVFVPCGGRPNSVTIHNVKKLLDAEGKPRFGIIVEGANLFFTQDARLKLEQAGAILFKDASANKGGVTSSSCEVLACLALNEEEHSRLMQVPGNDPKNIPAFYEEYVRSVQDVIESNARMEFETIWRENERTGTPRCLLTDRLSQKINVLNVALVNSQLWERLELRKKVVEAACPSVLVKLLGAEEIVKRVPVAYVRAIFGSYLASRYVYQYGLDASEFEFFDFITDFMTGSAASNL